MIEEESKAAAILADAKISPVLLGFSRESEKSAEIMKWILKPMEIVSEQCSKTPQWWSKLNCSMIPPLQAQERNDDRVE